jgi:large subunit ribosomal protein L17
MAYRKLGTSSSGERRSLLVNLIKAVVTHEKIETTEARAKEARKLIDKLITYAKKGTVEARRDALALVMNDKVVVKKAFDDLAVRYKERNGGYTRILKLKERRGDDALMVILELV